MSLEQKETITCPHCQKEGEFKIFSSVNTNINPELKEKIITGEIFVYKCPHCSEETLINYGMLYHDVEKHLMVQYVTNQEELKSATDMYNNVGMENIEGGDKIIKSLENYKKRIVTSQEALAEKILIEEENLDDKIVEVLKVMYLKMFFEQNPKAELNGAYFVKDEDQKLIVFITTDGENLAMEFDDFLYTQMEQKVNTLELEEDYQIDSNWALGVFDKLMEEDI